MDSEFAGQVMTAASGFDGIDIANQIGDRDIRRSQLLDITLVGSKPRQRRVVTLLGDDGPAALADGIVRIVVNLTTGYVGHLRIEQTGQRTQDATLGLSAKAQKNE